MKPKLLDLFSGAGGSARGYQLAGFHVTGVDINPQPRYAGDVFIQADAMTFPLDGYDAIHASPPCQGYSRMRHLPWLRDKQYPLLLEPTRERLAASGLPYAIENVEDAPMMKAPGLFGAHGVVLCGQMFGLPIWRHRPFESNVLLGQPYHPRHIKQGGKGRLLNERRGQRTEILTIAGHSRGWSPSEQAAAMGIDWMTRDELTQSIPPAYTAFVGEYLLAAVRERVTS